MWIRLFCILVFCLSVLGGAQPLYAQKGEFDREIPLLRLWAQSNPYKFPETQAGIRDAIRDYQGPVEPTVAKVEFYEFDSPKHVQGRIDSLLHGIKITLPPEYDHYGYEIRRYMSSVGRLEIYNNRHAIEEELVNIEKAWVVFRYWRENLLSELDSLDAAIKADDTASSKVKTMFTVNEAIVKAFIIEMQSWINANQELLLFLAENRKEYTFEKGNFLFKSSALARKFMNLFTTRERAKLQMRKYDPFGKIVY